MYSVSEEKIELNGFQALPTIFSVYNYEAIYSVKYKKNGKNPVVKKFLKFSIRLPCVFLKSLKLETKFLANGKLKQKRTSTKEKIT